MAQIDAPPAAHVALLPSSGMGHLLPFLRLATALRSHGCNVTLITAYPTVSFAESSHISAFLRSNPEVRHHFLHVLPLPSGAAHIDDPFFRQFEGIRRSLHLLRPLLLTSLASISALVTDIPLAAAMIQVLADVELPSYVLATSSAKFLSLICSLPRLISESVDLKGDGQVEIPGMAPMAKSSIPPPFTIPGHFFAAEIIANGASLPKFSGILINTFHQFEWQTLEALNGGPVMQGLPLVLPIGPLPAAGYQIEETDKEITQDEILQWLDGQSDRSVVYVSFGSRNALPKDQIAEIAKALDMSAYRFVWVLKRSKVDKEDREEIADLLGQQQQPFLENVGKKRGLVIKEWVDQEKILSHPATGGFVSHCGWNSIMEAAGRGLPILAWPLNGDQKVNAEVVVEAGLGVWDRSWGWGGQRVVAAEEIVGKLVELMEGGDLNGRAKIVGEEARRVVGPGGSSDTVFKQFIRGVMSQF